MSYVARQPIPEFGPAAVKLQKWKFRPEEQQGHVVQWIKGIYGQEWMKARHGLVR